VAVTGVKQMKASATAVAFVRESIATVIASKEVAMKFKIPSVAEFKAISESEAERYFLPP